MAETAPAQAATPATSAPAAPANGATAGAQNTPADQNATSRGLPYYEKLRRELSDTIAHKRAMDRSMVSAEPLGAWPVSPATYQLMAIHVQRVEKTGQDLIHDANSDWSDLDRPNSKTKSSVSNNPTSKRQRRATSSKASTITSKAHQVVQVSVRQG